MVNDSEFKIFKKSLYKYIKDYSEEFNIKFNINNKLDKLGIKDIKDITIDNIKTYWSIYSEEDPIWSSWYVLMFQDIEFDDIYFECTYNKNTKEMTITTYTKAITTTFEIKE